MSGMPFDMRNVSITADTTTLYIAVTPADTSYSQGVYQLDIIRMSANTAIKVTYGGEELSQNADGEYEYTLPASTDGTDNTTQKLVAEGVIVDGDNVTTDESIKLTISTSSTFYVNGDATYTDEMDVKATQPKANAVYIHVKSEDGTEKTFKVNILKLPETNGITAVDLTENKVAATYKTSINTYEGQAPYSEDGIVIYVTTADARSQVAVGTPNNFVTPTPINAADPTQGGIAKVLLPKELLEEEANGSTTTKLYVKRADGIVIDNSSMNIPTLIIKYASNNVGLYKVDSTPTTDPASPDYTGKVKQITDENGNIEYYLGINASDIITTGTALSINITAEANNTSSKVVIICLRPCYRTAFNYDNGCNI